LLSQLFLLKKMALIEISSINTIYYTTSLLKRLGRVERKAR